MVDDDGHQGVLRSGGGHVLTVPHIVVDGDHATGRSHALHLRWDAGAGRFWVARVSANTWRWVRTAQGWRISERVNASLDGTAGHREMLAPPDRTDPDSTDPDSTGPDSTGPDSTGPDSTGPDSTSKEAVSG